jgi:hypothetical protein
MSKLETQYRNWLKNNSTEKISFHEWLEKFHPINNSN